MSAAAQRAHQGRAGELVAERRAILCRGLQNEGDEQQGATVHGDLLQLNENDSRLQIKQPVVTIPAMAGAASRR
jgi:hypothetical protein